MSAPARAGWTSAWLVAEGGGKAQKYGRGTCEMVKLFEVVRSNFEKPNLKNPKETDLS